MSQLVSVGDSVVLIFAINVVSVLLEIIILSPNCSSTGFAMEALNSIDTVAGFP